MILVHVDCGDVVFFPILTHLDVGIDLCNIILEKIYKFTWMNQFYPDMSPQIREIYLPYIHFIMFN
jgi:hypothetical protein